MSVSLQFREAGNDVWGVCGFPSGCRGVRIGLEKYLFFFLLTHTRTSPCLDGWMGWVGVMDGWATSFVVNLLLLLFFRLVFYTPSLPMSLLAVVVIKLTQLQDHLPDYLCVVAIQYPVVVLVLLL